MKAKLTRGQLCVYELLDSISTEITAQDIFAQLRAKGRSLSLATVYRAIKTLQLRGLVQARSLTNGEWVYRLASEDCHYLTCLNCGRSIPVKGVSGPRTAKKIGKESEFHSVLSYSGVFFGLCEPCGETLTTIP